MSHWLVKSEPDVYSIDDLARDARTHWEGVRNYLARNHLRAMAEGDAVLFYHSNAEPAGVAGVARVARTAYPDLHARDPKSRYYDEADTKDEPRWSMVDVAFVRRLPRVVTLAELKADPELAGLEVARPGTRLSVTPVSAAHFARILAVAETPAPAEPPAPLAPRAAKKATAKKKAAKTKKKVANKKVTKKKKKKKKVTKSNPSAIGV